MTIEQGISRRVFCFIMSYEICFQLPDVKNFIYGDFESKYERTVFKKVPGAPPVAIFYTQSGKELERVSLDKFDRYIRRSLCICVLFNLHFSIQGGAQQDDGFQGNPAQSKARRSII